MQKRTLGNSNLEVSALGLGCMSMTGGYSASPDRQEMIAQGGTRMDLHPSIQAAATHVRTVYELGVTYFDCARGYWNGRSEEAYGIGLQGVRDNVFLTTKSQKRTAR